VQRQGSTKLEDHRSSHLQAKLVDLGEGNGFAFHASPFCHHATDGRVSCVFSGEIAQRPDTPFDGVAANHNGGPLPPLVAGAFCCSCAAAGRQGGNMLCCMLCYVMCPSHHDVGLLF